jgi:hypothetical protein
MKTDESGERALLVGERGRNGRFLPVNPGGPGRRPGDGREQYLEAFRRAVTPEDIEAVVRRVVEDAKGGNMVAARLLLERCLPPVSETPLPPEVRLQVIRAELAVRGSLPAPPRGANEPDAW